MENKATMTSDSDAAISRDENKTNDASEDFPISGDPSKYVTLPVQFEKLWRMYQATLDGFWTVHDIYLANDRESMLVALNQEERQCILELLAFMYTSHHTTINKDLFMQLMTQVEIKEASYYFGSQADAKKTHTMMFSMLIDELVRGESASMKDDLIKNVLQMPEVRSFLRWSIPSTSSSTKSFAQRLLAFTAIQALPGLFNSNDLIWRDEKLNLNFACNLFEYIDDELDREETYSIVSEAVGLAKAVFNKGLKVSRLGMAEDLMEQFIEHCADRIFIDMHVPKLYNKESPFDWVEEPKIESYKSMAQTNNFVDLSASFGETKFDTAVDF